MRNKIAPDSPDDTSSYINFLEEVERLVTPNYLECFTDETRKVRNFLLAISFGLILLSLGIIKISPDATFPILGMQFAVSRGVGSLMLIVCAYFLTLYVIRSYSEWKLWRLRQQAPLSKFMELHKNLFLSWKALFDEANARAVKSFKDAKVQDQLSEQRLAKHEADWNAEFEEKQRRYSELTDTYLREIEAPNIKLLEEQRRYLKDVIVRSKNILLVRFWWELIFPCVFGALAIVSGLLRL